MEGTPFGRYRLVSLLGRGGMGEVWRAYDTGTDRVVALKVLLPHFAKDPTYEQRFRREAHAAAQLNNPHVVPIHDYGEIEGRLFVAMALIEGHDLAKEIANGPLDPVRAVAIVGQIAGALQAAHRVGLVHRDVKPSNIQIDADDNAYLIDFGIARAATDPSVTSTGAAIGTWAYMAPERFTTNELDPRSDIYALACVLYECLTGTKPFPGDTLAQQLAGHLTGPTPRPSTLRSGIPAALDDVIATGMAKNLDERYPTAKDLATAAHEAITRPISPPRPELPAAPTPPRDTAATQPHAGLMTETPADTLSPTARTQVAGGPAYVHTAATQAVPGRRSRRKAIIIAATAILLVAATIAAITVVTRGGRTSSSSTSNGITTTTSPKPRTYGTQVVVADYKGLFGPMGVAVDTAGNIYVADNGNDRVVKIAAGTNAQTTLPFTGLGAPEGVAVDTAGNVYVTDWNNARVVMLAARTMTETVLPYSFNVKGTNRPRDVAVDTASTVYVTESWDRKVVMLAAGATTQTELPVTGVGNATWLAVDTAGNIYVVDTMDHQVVKIAAGTGTQTKLPFTGLNEPEGVAVDTAGTVYVVDSGNDRVLTMAAGATTQTELHFTGLDDPAGVAVDTAGNVYLADTTHSRVLKLPVT